MVKIFLYGWNWKLRNHSEKALTDLLTLQVHRFQVISTRDNKKFLWFSVLKNLVLKLLSKIPSSTLSSSCIKLFLPLQMILQVNLNSIIKKSELPVSKLSFILTYQELSLPTHYFSTAICLKNQNPKLIFKMGSYIFMRSASFIVNLFALPTQKVSILFITFNLIITTNLANDTLG